MERLMDVPGSQRWSRQCINWMIPHLMKVISTQASILRWNGNGWSAGSSPVQYAPFWENPAWKLSAWWYSGILTVLSILCCGGGTRKESGAIQIRLCMWKQNRNFTVICRIPCFNHRITRWKVFDLGKLTRKKFCCRWISPSIIIPVWYKELEPWKQQWLQQKFCWQNGKVHPAPTHTDCFIKNHVRPSQRWRLSFMRECCIEPTMSLVVYILVNPLHLRMNNRGFGISGAFGATHTGFHVKKLWQAVTRWQLSFMLGMPYSISRAVRMDCDLYRTYQKTHEEGIALRNVVRRKKLWKK